MIDNIDINEHLPQPFVMYLPITQLTKMKALKYRLQLNIWYWHLALIHFISQSRDMHNSNMKHAKQHAHQLACYIARF